MEPSGIIHVGAHDGHEYAETPPAVRLLLVEPQEKPYAALSAAFRGRPNTELARVACGSQEGVAVIHLAEPSESSSLLVPSGGGEVVFDGREVVTVLPLDEVADGEVFDLLRIDTQGYELEVLRGAERVLEGLDRIELEFHDPSVYAGAATVEELDRFLGERGFVRIAGHNLGDDGVYERES